MKVAILNADRKVENIILADEEFCEAAYPGRYVVLAVEQSCDMGWTWDGAAFHVSEVAP